MAIKEKKYSIFSLDNGLQTLVYPLENVNSISIIAIIRAGHLCEKVKDNGTAHILEHMLFDGTKSFPSYKKITEYFDKIAGEFAGATSYDFITLGGRFVDEEFENAMTFLEELIFHPLLKKGYFEKERRIIQDELASLEDSNNYKNFIQAKKIRFTDNSILSLPLGGTSQSVKELEHKQVIDFYDKHFVPNNMRFVIVGKCSQKNVKSLMEKTFGKHKSDNSLAHTQFSQKLFTRKKVDFMNVRSQKAYIRITFPSLNWKNTSKERVTLAYLCSLLSNRRDSLLFSHLREKLGWIYDINTDFFVSYDIGVLEIETSTPPEKSLPVIAEILKAISKVKKEAFDSRYFEKVKDIDRKRMKMIFDDQEGIIKWFSEEIAYRFPKILVPNDLINLYDQIFTEDIMKIAKKLLDMNKINISVLQSFDKKEQKVYKETVNKLLDEQDQS